MNVWNFTGNLGQDAEQRSTQDGTAITSFSVAVRSGFGEREATTWARCSMFGRRGEAVAPYLTKGQQVAISGELTAREWQDKEGLTRTSIEVRVNDLTLIGKRDDSGTRSRNQAPKSEERPLPEPSANLADMDDDIPF